MVQLLLPIIYISFISLGLPDSLLGSAWPSMYPALGVPVSYAGLISMIISFGTIVSSLNSDRLTRALGTGKVTVLSVAMTAAALFGFSISTQFWMLCLWAVPYGLGAGSVDAALNNYVALHYKSRHMSWLHCMWGIGTMISPMVMGRVLAGTALTALGTNLWGLNYLLPGIGLVLMLLGFRLLWREEIEACRGAIQMVVSVQEFDQKGGFCRSSGSNPLCITGVRVKLTGEPAGWMIFHHSLWNTAPPFHGTAAIQLCRYTSRMSCGAPPERSPAGFCTIGTGRPSGRPTTLWRRIPPPTDIRASMDSGAFSGHFLCPLRRSTGGAMWSMPPMKFLTQNTEMCWIAGSITAIRTDFCNTRQKRHWKTGCPIMGHFGPSGAICATVPK